MPYTYKRSIAIDHTKCGSGNSTDFPVLVSISDATFKTVGNSGHVQNASGFDVAFFSDPGLTSPLNFEVEQYVATTGVFIAWVKVPTLSVSVDTVIYVGYGDATISTFQGNVAGTWDANFKTVIHHGNGTTLSATDSTSNANNGTITGATAVAGQVDGAATFNGTSDKIVLDNAKMPAAYPITYEVWAKSANAGATARTPLSHSNSTTDNARIMFEWPWGDGTTNTIAWDVKNTTEAEISFNLSADGLYHHAVGVSRSATDHEFYVDGVSRGTNTTNVPFPTLNAASIGYWNGSSQTFFAGDVDEVRISNVSRSVSYIVASYNNQSNPGGFYTLGAESGLDLAAFIGEPITSTSLISS